jgi:hypothetical protein
MNKLLCTIALALALIGGAQADELARSDDRAIIREGVKEAEIAAGVPRPVVEAEGVWDDCVDAAVERFADQPEDAHTVAEAALASCSVKETKYLLVRGRSDEPDLLDRSKTLREAVMPDLLARVMEIRAAHGQTQKQPPVASPATH